jgi:hypothetical protein
MRLTLLIAGVDVTIATGVVPPPVLVAVAVAVRVTVAVGVKLAVAVLVAVAVAVAVSVAVAVAVGVIFVLPVGVAVAFAVGVRVGVTLTLAVAVCVAVIVAVLVGVDDAVGVSLMVAVGVGVAVMVGVGVATGSDNLVTSYCCGARISVPSWNNFAIRTYCAGESFAMLTVRSELGVVGRKDPDRTVAPLFLHTLSSNRYFLRSVPGDACSVTCTSTICGLPGTSTPLGGYTSVV